MARERRDHSEPEVVLVATSGAVLAIIGDVVRTVHQGSGQYFGMAELGGQTYVACANQVVAQPTVAELEAFAGSLLVLDPELRPLHEVAPADFTLRQPHGLAAIGTELYVACSYDDMIAIYDRETDGWDRWEPDRGAGRPKTDHDDRFHYNTVVPTDQGLRVLAHNYGVSQVLDFELPSRELISVAEVGVGAHDLFVHDGVPAVCSSLESALRGVDGWVRRVGGFPRGILARQHRWLGISEFSGRGDRHQTTARVHRMNTDWDLEQSFEIPGAGQVLSLHPWRGPAEVLDGLPEHPGVAVLRPGDRRLEACLGYQVPISFPPLPGADWHTGEPDQQWMAARHARVPVVLNPGDETMAVVMVDDRPSPAPVEVLVAGEGVGVIRWSGDRRADATFVLPEAVRARGASGRDVAIEFVADELWQPPGDPRRIGAGLCSIRFT